MNKKFLIVLSVLVLGVVGGIWGPDLYRRAMWVEQDLGKLAPYAATQNYVKLFEALHAKTPAPTGFTFVVLGDTRSDIGAARDVMAHAAQEQPTFIMHTGDLVRHGTVDEFFAHHLQLVDQVAPIPVIPVVGNHEDGPNKDFSAFKAIYGDDRFSFDYGGCRFVGVNNVDRDGMGQEDLSYLEQELSKPGATHRFVFFHRPPHFLKIDSESEDGRGFTWHGEALRNLMTRLKVDEVFLGHIHGYATEVVDGVRYTISGGGGAPLATTLGEEGNVCNYVVVQVAPEGVKNTVARLEKGQWVRTPIE